MRNSTRILLATLFVVTGLTVYRALRPLSSSTDLAIEAQKVKTVNDHLEHSNAPTEAVEREPTTQPPAAAPAPRIPATSPPMSMGLGRSAIGSTTDVTSEPMNAHSISSKSSELTASYRMIRAHASLRKREVADPDSPENKAILQQMISKALARANEPSL